MAGEVGATRAVVVVAVVLTVVVVVVATVVVVVVDTCGLTPIGAEWLADAGTASIVSATITVVIAARFMHARLWSPRAVTLSVLTVRNKVAATTGSTSEVTISSRGPGNAEFRAALRPGRERAPISAAMAASHVALACVRFEGTPP